MDKTYAIALVHAWLLRNPGHYCAWVNPYTQLRWCNEERRMIATKVGGHYRRLGNWGKVLPALRCTCKFEVLDKPAILTPPQNPWRARWDTTTGEFIPNRYRVLVWA